MTDDTKAILIEITRGNDLVRETLRMVVAQNALLQAVVDAMHTVSLAYQETSQGLTEVKDLLEGNRPDRAPPSERRPFRARTPRNWN